LVDYLVFGVCAALGAVMIGVWFHQRFVTRRQGRGKRW
jgi:hypothetical protein